METAIEVRDLKKRYGETVAVDGISFEVGRGEVLGLLGPNGAGKTTTVECLLGLRTADSGTVRVLGIDPGAGAGDVRSRVGAQLQTTGLMSRLTVREQLSLFARLFPRSSSVDELLNRLDLREKARTMTRALSGGQRQRLAVALALVNDPDVVFLDEPTTGLDPQARRGLWDVVRDLRRAGKAVLLTTHCMEEAEQLCDRVAIVDHGRVIALGSPAGLIYEHFHETAIDLVPINGTNREELQELPAVERAVSENGHVTLYSRDVPATMSGMFGMADGGSLAFKDVSIRQATLEDLFLKITGRRIRE